MQKKKISRKIGEDLLFTSKNAWISEKNDQNVGLNIIVSITSDCNPENENFDNVSYLACTSENNYFPDLSAATGKDVIYFCSPNNPTGHNQSLSFTVESI